jgi:hypothetical protein
MKIFQLDVTFEDICGVDFNALVLQPAHGKNFLAFNQAKLLFANDEQRTITGVMIAANKSIPRYDASIGKYSVYFTAKSIKTMAIKFFEQNNTNNVNIEHNPNNVAKGISLFESFIVDGVIHQEDERIGSKIGDWVVSYYVKNDKLWKDAKEGKFKGFSVEGIFQHLERKLLTKNKNQKMSEAKKSFREMLFGSTTKTQVFAEVTAEGGIVIFYEGELEVGTAVSVDVDGEKVTAPANVYVLEGEMTGTSLVVNEEGIVDEIIVATEEPTEDAVAEVAEAMKAIVEEVNSLKAENATMKEEMAALKLSFAKFSKEPKEEPALKFPKGTTRQELLIQSLKNK